MLTKGVIEKVISPYKAKVRMPVYDRLKGANYSTTTENLSEATVCSIPNCDFALNVGDVVFVSIEDNDFHKPVIVGFLYSQNKALTQVDAKLNSLEVITDTKLSSETTIGKVSAESIQSLYGVKENIQAQIDELKGKSGSDNQKDIDALKEDVSELQDDVAALETDLSTNYVDKSTSQIVGGQKDFEVVPRIYVDPGAESHNLPLEYDELLYLANTGEQYIDCNYTPAANSDIVFDMEVGCTRQTGRRNFLCCCGTTVYGHYCEILPNGYFGTRINNIDYVTDVFAQPNQKYSVKMTKIANAGNSVSVTVGESTVTCTAAQSKSVLSPIYLFRLASGYTGESIIFYSCKIYVNNTLIRDMYPCERISDHTLGMYDKANDVFYSNAGGGQFISGGSINPHYEPVLTGSRLSEVAYTGDYNSLYGTPIIPTVNNPLITIKQGTVTKGTFNLNQSSAKTITLDGIDDLLKQVSGYDSTVSQTLKHSANGVIQWVND